MSGVRGGPRRSDGTRKPQDQAGVSRSGCAGSAGSMFSRWRATSGSSSFTVQAGTSVPMSRTSGRRPRSRWCSTEDLAMLRPSGSRRPSLPSWPLPRRRVRRRRRAGRRRARRRAPTSALIPEGGDVMVYGDGGAGKTTLVDRPRLPPRRRRRLARDPRPAPGAGAADRERGAAAAVPREAAAQARRLERLAARRPRCVVLEEPWARLSFADDADREALADAIRELEVDVVIVGPVTRSGMNEAGTLAGGPRLHGARRRRPRPLRPPRRRSCSSTTRTRAARSPAPGKASGDTLLHVQGQGPRPHPPVRPEGPLVERAPRDHAAARLDGRRRLHGRGQAGVQRRDDQRDWSSPRSPKSPAPTGGTSRRPPKASATTVYASPATVYSLPAASSMSSSRTASRPPSRSARSGRRRASTSPTIPPSNICATTPAQTRHRLSHPGVRNGQLHLRRAPRPIGAQA